MAKQQTPVVPNFRDMDKEATARAQSSIAGGKQPPLTPPKSAKVSGPDKKGVQYTRWSERAVVQIAYRTVTGSGLLDAVVVTKVRQSETKENTGKKVFGHGYLNVGANVPEKHQDMNDRTNGYILSLLQATGYAPTNGTVSGSLLSKMFPSKGQPGTASPCNSKNVVINIVQELGPQKNFKTGKVVLDADGEPILEKRDRIESFLPDVAESDEVEETDEDETEVEEETDEEE